MNETAVKALMAEIAPVIRDYVDGAAEQMAAAFTAASKDVTDRAAALEAENKELKARISTLEDAAKKPVEIDLTPVEKLIEAEIAKLPKPEPAKEVDREELATLVNEAVSALPPPQDGKSIEIEDVLPAIAAEVARAFDAYPVPKDGEPGKDGRGIKDLLIDREGNLVATMNDGEMKVLGHVIGKDGAPGRDGFNLDAFDCEVVDERTIKLKFEQGDVCHSYELQFPVPVYQGVFKEGTVYSAADMVTWGGSCWIAKEETTTKPDGPEGAWQLAVKRGRDGKDFKPKDAA